MNDLSTAIFGLHGQALALRQQKLELIASNIANQDTPGYKAQDLDFVQALSQVQQQQELAKQSAQPRPDAIGFPSLELGRTDGQRAAEPAPLHYRDRPSGPFPARRTAALDGRQYGGFAARIRRVRQGLTRVSGHLEPI